MTFGDSVALGILRGEESDVVTSLFSIGKRIFLTHFNFGNVNAFSLGTSAWREEGATDMEGKKL